MEYRSLETNVISAKDLKKVNLISKMHPYAVVSISGNPRVSQQQRTAVDRSGNASPTWNSPLKFAVEGCAAQSLVHMNMEYRSLEINAMSTKDLKKVNLIGKMRPYAVVSISGGDPRASQPQWTAVDRSGNASPTWNYPLKFAVEESATRSNRLGVTFRIRCERTLGDKDIGEVHVPLSELNGPTEDGELLHSVTYQVRRPSGKPKQGELNFSYKWGEKMASAPAVEVNVSQEPVPAQVGPSPISPAPPTGYWYPPPQPGYAYPPPPPYYGYPPVQQPQKNNWLAKLMCVELVKLCLGDVTADCFGSDPGVL